MVGMQFAASPEAGDAVRRGLAGRRQPPETLGRQWARPLEGYDVLTPRLAKRPEGDDVVA